MDQRVILNNNPYRMCDLGEGKCLLIITSVSHIDSLTTVYTKHCVQRLIVLDTSVTWPVPMDYFTHIEMAQIIDDISLLLDIYWLEEAKIVLEPPMEHIAEDLIKVFKIRSNVEIQHCYDIN